MKFAFPKLKKNNHSESGSALVMVVGATVGAILLMWGASRVAGNMNKAASGIQTQLGAIKSSQEISLNGMAQAFTSGQKGTCAAGTFEMSVTAANGKSVKLCLRGTRVGESLCIDNPNYPGDSSKAVCMQTVNGQYFPTVTVASSTSGYTYGGNVTTTTKTILMNWGTGETTTSQAPSCTEIEPCSCPPAEQPEYCNNTTPD